MGQRRLQHGEGATYSSSSPGHATAVAEAACSITLGCWHTDMILAPIMTRTTIGKEYQICCLHFEFKLASRALNRDGRFRVN